MKKKKILILLISVFVLIVVYFGYKCYCMNYMYSFTSDKTYISNLTKLTEPITIKKTSSDKDYITYKNVRVANYFADFNYDKELDFDSTRTYLLRNEDNSLIAGFMIGIYPTLVSTLKDNDFTLYEEKTLNYMSKVNWEKVFKKHSINHDVEFLELLASNYKKEVNIFTSIKKIKEVNALKLYAEMSIPEINNITLINGDYSGFIFNIPNYGKEVRIIENDKTYILSFLKSDYFNDNLINEIVSTLVID